jgi:hypothetical protein
MDSSEHNVPPSLSLTPINSSIVVLKKGRIFPPWFFWLTSLHGCLFSGDRGRGGGGGGGREAVLRRVPHHRDAHVARRADGAQGERSTLLPSHLPLPSDCLEMIGAPFRLLIRAHDRHRWDMLAWSNPILDQFTNLDIRDRTVRDWSR